MIECGCKLRLVLEMGMQILFSFFFFLSCFFFSSTKSRRPVDSVEDLSIASKLDILFYSSDGGSALLYIHCCWYDNNVGSSNGGMQKKEANSVY